MNDLYQTPLATRYASKEVAALFSTRKRVLLWRKLWIALAKAEKELGLPISDQQIKELEDNLENIDLERGLFFEKKVRHDVMAQIHLFAEQCPKASPILHLGATSTYVTDNADLILIKEALSLLKNRMVYAIGLLSELADTHKSLATVGYTHFQAAQPTTVGKRICLWLQDLLMDFKEIERFQSELSFLGVKGATGTQASFLQLFDGNKDKVKKLEELVAKEMGFDKIIPIAGQTYPRKEDLKLSAIFSGIGASTHKMATDLRLLCHMEEIEEPRPSSQVGSSAMPYKKNPMLSERICGLARFLISLQQNPVYTAASQWLERSLDDSANRRLYLPESFLCADGILSLVIRIAKGLQINKPKIQENLEKKKPEFASEAILMEAVKKGKDRQNIHEALRTMFEQNSFSLENAATNPNIGLSLDEIKELTQDETLIGLAKEQVKEFLQSEVLPMLSKQNKEHALPDTLDV